MRASKVHCQFESNSRALARETNMKTSKNSEWIQVCLFPSEYVMPQIITTLSLANLNMIPSVVLAVAVKKKILKVFPYLERFLKVPKT